MRKKNIESCLLVGRPLVLTCVVAVAVFGERSSANLYNPLMALQAVTPFLYSRLVNTK